MSAARVVRCPDAQATAAAAASIIAELVTSARELRGRADLALSGGSLEELYRLLGPAVGDWRHVHLWYCDERLVPRDDPRSNHALATRALRAPGAVWHAVATQHDADRAASSYATELDGTVLDVALCGMGPDGHTASLFPGHPALRARGVAIAVHDAPKPPPTRVSLTLSKLNESRAIVLVVTGAAKAPMLTRVLSGPSDTVPASLLDRRRMTIVADANALADA